LISRRERARLAIRDARFSILGDHESAMTVVITGIVDETELLDI